MSDIKKDNKDLTIKDSDDRFRSLFKSFFRNEHHTFVVQKSEKLASALYMVTGFVPGDDPLRTRLRTCALDLISTSADSDRARQIQYHEGFASRCLEIGSILKLAERAGFISQMNAQVLCDEYAELASFVQKHRDKVFGATTLEGADGSTQTLPGWHGAPASNRTHTAPRPEPFDKEQARQFSKGHNNKRHINRRDAILRLLDKKDKITIKDAVSSIEGCSEKTIQRELISLVQEGVLLKDGERRWSTYSKSRS